MPTPIAKVTAKMNEEGEERRGDCRRRTRDENSENPAASEALTLRQREVRPFDYVRSRPSFSGARRPAIVIQEQGGPGRT